MMMILCPRQTAKDARLGAESFDVKCLSRTKPWDFRFPMATVERDRRPVEGLATRVGAPLRLPDPEGSASGKRLYPAKQLDRLRLIKPLMGSGPSPRAPADESGQGTGALAAPLEAAQCSNAFPRAQSLACWTNCAPPCLSQRKCGQGQWRAPRFAGQCVGNDHTPRRCRWPGPPQPGAASAVRMASMRARLTPKSRRPSLDAERTCTTPPSASSQNSASSTKPIQRVVNCARR